MNAETDIAGETRGAADLPGLLARQREAAMAEGPPPRERRRADLAALRAALLARREQIERAVSADYGHRSRHETAIMEIATTVQGIDYLARNLRRFMRPERRRVAATFQPARAWVERQPLGVVGIIAPWNYPVNLSLMPLATALAAGNRAMLKPSEFTPETSALLGRMLAETFPEDRVATVSGGAEVAAAFAALPFDHLFFTGGTGIGRAVMRAASENLVPVTLELGGKSPVIVAPGHAGEKAAGDIAFGKLANAGQTCVAPDYVLVHEGERDGFVAAYDRAVGRLYPEGPASRDYTAIISARHVARLTALVDDARARGAQVRQVGRHPEAAEGRARTLAPAVVLGATGDMEIMREEIFGPVLPVLTYRDPAEAIGFVNARPRPLALYYFGPDDAGRREVLRRTVSGNVGLDSTLLHVGQDDLPFGGVGASGMGAYHGVEGFRAMSHAKGVFAPGRWSAARLVRAPYGRLAEAVLRVLLR